jgi:hypothetical protein
MEMQYGSRANISHQPPGRRDFVDLRLFPLLPLSSSKSHKHQPPQSTTGPCLGTRTPRVEQLVAIRANLRLIELDNKLTSTRLENYIEDETSGSDVQEVDIEEVQGEDTEA